MKPRQSFQITVHLDPYIPIPILRSAQAVAELCSANILLYLTSNFYVYRAKWVRAAAKTIAGMKINVEYTNNRGKLTGCDIAASKWGRQMITHNMSHELHINSY